MAASLHPALRRAVPLPFALLLGCYASSVVATADRAVRTAPLPTEWRPATAADLAGYFASVEVTGAAAASLRQVYYWFAAGGRYTGAALIDGDAGPSFQTLEGSWQFGDGGLVLDGQDPVPVDVAADHLRIRAPGGAVVLRREVLR
jgi:hypothetical protein